MATKKSHRQVSKKKTASGKPKAVSPTLSAKAVEYYLERYGTTDPSRWHGRR